MLPLWPLGKLGEALLIGIEPMALRLTAARSNQLSYRSSTFVIYCLTLWPLGYTVKLTAEGFEPTKPCGSKILSLIYNLGCCMTNWSSTRCGIRTHEAETQHLKCCPFDRSGNLVWCSQWDLNPRLSAHKTDTLTNWVMRAFVWPCYSYNKLKFCSL